MFVRTVAFSLAVLSFGLSQPIEAGIYNTTDAPEETSRYSQDFEGVFRPVLLDLQLIPNPNPQRNPPIRRRYLLVETLGLKGALELKSMEQKLDYSAVLIRRGKPEEAVQVLVPLTGEHPDNFLILSQCAMAHFLAANEDLRANAVDYMQDAMKKWPAHWDQVDADQQKFLISIGWEETAFDRYRRYESYLERLMRHRRSEQRNLKRKQPVAETVDPIFGPEKSPVRFVEEAGAFAVGRIAPAEFQKLPKDAIEAVEQLLIWMPRDDRLLWLLGEVLNADAMNSEKEEGKNQAIKSASLVFKKLMDDSFDRPIYARKEIQERHELLKRSVEKMPPPRHLDPAKFGLDREEDPNTSLLTSEQWWRVLIVGFLTGFSVGLFALWQIQEMRRRRQGRGAT